MRTTLRIKISTIKVKKRTLPERKLYNMQRLIMKIIRINGKNIIKLILLRNCLTD